MLATLGDSEPGGRAPESAGHDDRLSGDPKERLVRSDRRGVRTPSLEAGSAPGDGGSSSLLVIQERDVGLFSMVWQVLNTLYLLEDQKIDRVPIAAWGQGLAYFHPDGHEGRRTVWEYYFEPLVAGFSEDRVLSVLGARAFELLESKRKQLEHERGAVEFPDDLHWLRPLTDEDRSNIAEIDELVSAVDWTWTESFYPTVGGGQPAPFAIPSDRAADLIRRYVRPREHIRRKASELFEARLRGHYVIGVHVRGTDGLSDPGRPGTIPFGRCFQEIGRRLTAVGASRCRVFLATDEQYVVDLFQRRFGDELVLYDAVRSAKGAAPLGTGPTGQRIPGYIATDRDTARRNGDDAVVEFTLLTQSDFLVHNPSSLSAAARLYVPEGVLL